MPDVDHDALIVDMRAAAAILERCNAAYNYDPSAGRWSPQSLRYEAQYLEDHRDRMTTINSWRGTPMSRAAYRHQETLDGHALPRSPKPGDRCGYCGAPDGEGTWLNPDGDTGWLCEDCA